MLDPHKTIDLRPVDYLVTETTQSVPESTPGRSGSLPQLPGYDNLRELGRGGTATIFQAWQTGCHRLVALKVIWLHRVEDVHLTWTRNRARREVRLLARLEHPHIIPIHDAGEANGWFYTALKLLKGGSLRRRLPALMATPDQAAQFLIPVAEAIHYAHELGVIHCDLKPSNILFDEQDTPYLCDFGAARGWGERPGEASGEEIILGTPAYMAPEQTVLRGVLTPGTDVHALGVILYELLTGQLPFQGGGVKETIQLVQQATARRPALLNPACPSPLEDLCLWCLEKDPAQRPASSQVVAEQLRDFLARRPEAAGSSPATIVRLRSSVPGAAGADGRPLLEAGVAALPHGVLVLNTAGKVVQGNPAAARIVGRDLTGQSFLAWLGSQRWLQPDAVTSLSAQTLPPIAALRGELPDPVEAYLTTGSGGRGLWLILGAQPLAEGSDPAGAVVWLMDITADKSRRQAGELYHSLMTSLGLNVFRKDLEGRYTFVNQPFCRTLGRRPEGILGRTDHDLFAPDIARIAREREQQMLASGESVEYIEEHTPSRCQPGCRCRLFRELGDAASEQCYFQMLLAPVQDENQRAIGIQGAFWDITARYRAERQLQRTAAALEQANAELGRSNAELQQFAYVASHDLQEPLRMVASFTRLLQKRYQGQLDEEADQYISFAVNGATRMQRLINDLLAYSRVGNRGQPLQDTSAEEAFDQAVENLSETIRERNALVSRGTLPRVKGDAGQLVQLFQNLIGNAVKFCAAAPPTVQVSARRDGEEWVFTVRDNGIGMEARHLERIFVIFQRLHTRNEYPGSGIGLAICRKIVERHGGRIWVESEPGQGSRFHFTLLGERQEKTYPK